MKNFLLLTLSLCISTAMFAADAPEGKNDKDNDWLTAKDPQSYEKRKKLLDNFTQHASFPLSEAFEKDYRTLKIHLVPTSQTFFDHMMRFEEAGCPFPGKLALATTLKNNVEKEICSNDDLENAKTAFTTLSTIVSSYIVIHAKYVKNKAKRANRKRRNALQSPGRKLVFGSAADQH